VFQKYPATSQFTARGESTVNMRPGRISGPRIIIAKMRKKSAGDVMALWRITVGLILSI
jgi:hypothetical protein